MNSKHHEPNSPNPWICPIVWNKLCRICNMHILEPPGTLPQLKRNNKGQELHFPPSLPYEVREIIFFWCHYVEMHLFQKLKCWEIYTVLFFPSQSTLLFSFHSWVEKTLMEKTQIPNIQHPDLKIEISTGLPPTPLIPNLPLLSNE